MSALLLLLTNALIAAVPAVGFAMAFNVPQRYLWRCGAAGALGFAVRGSLMAVGAPIEWATFVAAACIGWVTALWARRTLAPMQLYGVAAIIPMIPGSYAFNTVIGLVEMSAVGASEPLMEQVLVNGIKTVFIVGALSVGLALPSLLYYRNRSIV
ncbi:threonine/serine exporter family protein [Ferrimonas balearica]|uniref:threonine/serine exporter family protein n=1 Tax=Ferrimonas balearica TaxID=44012 RepID=UPI001C99086F|nr:threonine/serine exporter family protein [Ferrimonas balearica]MBY5993026.1 threonine/serine exporter family protein [Ferrimonas balearica]